uniref:Uncharacterized protein n=1 Tax=Parascaris equorum TaxID=6256 RepID=A0A914RRH8_PAREQ
MRSLATKQEQDVVRNSSLSPSRPRNSTLRTLADRVQSAAQRGQQRLRSQHSSGAGISLQDEANSSNIEVQCRSAFYICIVLCARNWCLKLLERGRASMLVG